MSVRKAAVSGMFYPSNRNKLLKAIEWSFVHKIGPGKLPAVDKNGPHKLKGLVVPHAGYQFSGPVAAHSYSKLASDGIPESIIILGVNHNAIGSRVAVTLENFETPLGIAEVDRELAKKLIGKILVEDSSSHLAEHSIEVQVPFLQYLFGDDLKFVPILVQYIDLKNAMIVADEIRNAIGKRNVLVIASTDFSHYVPIDYAYRNDRRAIEMIEQWNASGLEHAVERYGISMCGVGPVLTMMNMVKATKVTLLKYSTSGDIEKMSDVVGYAAISVE